MIEISNSNSSRLNNLKPIKIERTSEQVLRIIWNDDSISEIKLEKLRKLCPCAGCVEDRKNTKSGFIGLDTFDMKKNKLIKLELVGNYAVKPIWGDGHESGIYSWDYLKNIK